MSGKDLKQPLRVSVLASGYGSNLQALINRQTREPADFEVALVVANSPDAYALVRAQKAVIPHVLIDHRAYKTRALFESQILKKLVEHKIELLVLAGFTRILSANFLKRFSHPIINIHPSLLPKYPGLHAINQAFCARDFMTGCTIHMVDEGLDTGGIIAQASCPIFKLDSLEDVTERVHSLEHALLPVVVEMMAKMAVKSAPAALGAFEKIHMASKKNAAYDGAYAHEHE